ncbi:ATP-dependent DNA helicase RecG [Lagierella sp.]|uniref:ATP-dependent DNA helicase RecG n=1 Tax=Lagierella sp. TaxID=2849657 RepID=UPI002606F87D|nr:ATP-dependent DNA helicase RecG [Lagierella sp.]
MRLDEIRGLGPKKKAYLKLLKIETVEDLLAHYPFRYEDRREVKSIEQAYGQEDALLKLEILNNINTRYIGGRKSISSVKATDGTHKIELNWFNQPYISNNYKVEDWIFAFGKVESYKNLLKMTNPIVEEKLGNNLGKIVPVYPLTKGLTQRDLRNFLEYTIKNYPIEENLPPSIIKKFDLMDLRQAIINIHFPKSKALLQKALYRLKFQELLIYQLYLDMNYSQSNKKGISFKVFSDIYEFIEKLPFKLTKAQNRVVKEILEDMSSPFVMNRLVQGDVGSGKTITAAIGILNAYFNGYQSVLMAPTEILATQHYESLRDIFMGYGIRLGLLKGSLSKKNKEQMVSDIQKGLIDIIVSTHAVLEDNVTFENIGLVITDEQHRFGVKQRAILTGKGNVDTIVMSATPIPRTLALAKYGSLDISTIDQLPEGRKVIETYAVGMEYEERIMKFLIKQVQEGRQCYIVCPLIEESESLNLTSVEDLYGRLNGKYFRNIKTGLVHGSLNPRDKDKVMESFIKNDIKILFSTTVIEVGVNVPNANTMVIYNAERFGLSQLHQLRGRVGRGKFQSYCILINSSRNKISRQRMRIMESTNDGFLIAKKDLELRGSGDVIGVRQSGDMNFKLVDFFRDIELFEKIQSLTKEIVENNFLNTKEYRGLSRELDRYSQSVEKEIIFN